MMNTQVRKEKTKQNKTKQKTEENGKGETWIKRQSARRNDKIMDDVERVILFGI